jgi:hypothetical protein
VAEERAEWEAKAEWAENDRRLLAKLERLRAAIEADKAAEQRRLERRRRLIRRFLPFLPVAAS